MRLGGIWRFQGVVGLFVAFHSHVRNYFRPYLSISACAIEAQHSNENCSTITDRSNGSDRIVHRIMKYCEKNKL